MYNGMKAKIVRINKTKPNSNCQECWLNIKVKEGKNRQIRNALQQLHIKILRMIRVQFGPYKLKNIEKGSVMEIPIIKELRPYTSQGWILSDELINQYKIYSNQMIENSSIVNID